MTSLLHDNLIYIYNEYTIPLLIFPIFRSHYFVVKWWIISRSRVFHFRLEPLAAYWHRGETFYLNSKVEVHSIISAVYHLNFLYISYSRLIYNNA